MNLRRSLIATASPFAFAALWLGGAAYFGGAASLAVAGDPPMNPTKPDPGMADPAKPDPAKPDPGMGDPAMADPAKPADPNAAKVAPVPVADAQAELTHLKEYLKNSKSDNGDILAALDAVEKAYHNLAVPPDGDTTKAAVEADNLKFREAAEKAYLEAFEKKRIKGTAKTNDRDDVNIKAIQILGKTGGERAEKLTTTITQALDQRIFKAKDYDVPTTIYDESFKAIAILNDKKVGLPFVRDWLKFDNSPNAPEKVKAAFDAVVLFKDVNGPTRQDIVKKLTTDFVGVENAAEINKDKDQRSKKVVWDKIKPSVIKALQVFCGSPKGKAGALLASVKDLKAWYDDHDKPRDPAWVDAKPAK